MRRDMTARCKARMRYLQEGASVGRPQGGMRGSSALVS